MSDATPPVPPVPPVPPYGGAPVPPSPAYGAPVPPAPGYGASVPPYSGAPVPPAPGYGAAPVPPYAGPVPPNAAGPVPPAAYDGGPYGAPPAPPLVVRPVRGIAAAVRWLVLAAGAISLILAGVEAYGLIAIEAFENGNADIGALSLYDGASVALAVVLTAVVVAAGICWFVWQYRAAVAATAGGAAPRRAPVWHVVSWFIPVVLLWFPFQNVRDLARGSRAALSGAVLGWWWALWLLATITSRIGAQIGTAADSLEGISTAAAVSLASDLFLAAAAPLAWLIVTRITDALQPAPR